ncbi:MAG: hypothetical protein ABL959_17670, partial [Pyrinomonadaceae bacterium]
MASEKLVRRTAGSMKANVRMLLGIMLVLGVVFGLSFWRSGRVAAEVGEKEVNFSRVSIPTPDTVPVKNQEDSPESTILTFGNSSLITVNDNTTASPYPSTIT